MPILTILAALFPSIITRPSRETTIRTETNISTFIISVGEILRLIQVLQPPAIYTQFGDMHAHAHACVQSKHVRRKKAL